MNIARKSDIFLLFQGGGVRTPCPLTGSAHAPPLPKKRFLFVHHALVSIISFKFGHTLFEPWHVISNNVAF